MELRNLRNFTAVAEEGSISKAAERLKIAQPPLSVQMKKLEEELGCSLFIRGPRNITLTEAGECLYDKAKTILALSDRIPQDIADSEKAEAHLRLGVISSVSSYVPANIIPGFMRNNPGIIYDIYEMNTYKLLDALHSGMIGMAIVRTPFQSRDIQSCPIRSEMMYAVGAPEHFGGSGDGSEGISIKELEGKPLIIYRRWEKILSEQCRQNGFVPRCVCINDDARTTLSWACSGLGIGIVPASIIPEGISREISVRAITDSELSSRIMLVWVKGRKLSPCESSFADYIGSLG
ncbi:MAG: LysR family transcriptional regulator [Huintestinicola sp.]